jgi:acyl-coenzyme A thioesterase PaaI-like protein
VPLPDQLDGSLFGDDQPCFGCSPRHPFGFRLKCERQGDGVVARFTPGEQYQGPPGIMHGGLVMTLADEIAAWAILARLEKFGFTTGFEGKFRGPVRIGAEAVATATLTREGSRVVRVQVRITQQGAECFTGELAFVLLDQSGAERLLRAPLPEAWQRFAR